MATTHARSSTNPTSLPRAFINRGLRARLPNAFSRGRRVTPRARRVKYAAIFASTSRVLPGRVATSCGRNSPLRLRRSGGPGTQLERVAERTAASPAARQAFHADLNPSRLAGTVPSLRQVSDAAKTTLTAHFVERVFPVLTPLAVDPGHPFPYISNLSLNLAVWLRDPTDRRSKFARVKVPPLLQRFLPTDDASTFVPLEDVIAAN